MKNAQKLLLFILIGAFGIQANAGWTDFINQLSSKINSTYTYAAAATIGLAGGLFGFYKYTNSPKVVKVYLKNEMGYMGKKQHDQLKKYGYEVPVSDPMIRLDNDLNDKRLKQSGILVTLSMLKNAVVNKENIMYKKQGFFSRPQRINILNSQPNQKNNNFSDFIAGGLEKFKKGEENLFLDPVFYGHRTFYSEKLLFTWLENQKIIENANKSKNSGVMREIRVLNKGSFIHGEKGFKDFEDTKWLAEINEWPQSLIPDFPCAGKSIDTVGTRKVE